MARFPQRPLAEVLPSAAGAGERACPHGACDGGGWIEDEATRTARPCACREQIVAQRRVRSLNQRIPRKFRNLGWERHPLPEIEATNPLVVRSVRSFCRRIDEHLDAGDGLWLWGRKGTGKTTLAYLVTQSAIEAGRSVAVYTGPALLNALRDTYRDDSPISTLALIERLSEVDLLHLEDLAVARPTEWVLEQLYTIVNNRYDEQRSIVFTSDAQGDGDDEDPNPMRLAEAVGQRTLSRLIEMCGDAKPMMGDDKRLHLGPIRDDVAAGAG
jgi:DNA replication protein DnaC